MADTRTLPIFPLSVVLFPGGSLPLRIFEPRYLRMVSECMRAEHGFVVALIRDGREAGPAAKFFEIGTVAEIVEWSQGGDGMLHLATRGSERVQVISSEVAPDRLISGQVLPIEAEPATGVAACHGGLVDLLKQAYRDNGRELPGAKLLADATWVGFRLAEMLPMPIQRRQWLLELTNPTHRLDALQELLELLLRGGGSPGESR